MSTRKPRPAKAQSPSTVQPVSDERLARIGAWHNSPAGALLRDTGTELENGIALLDVLLVALDASPGDEREATVLRLALERLERASEHLDRGDSTAACAFQPAAEGAQS